MTPMPPDKLMALQAYLRRRGFNLGTTGSLSDGVDGDWGASTDAALSAFLEKEGMVKTAPSTPAPPRPAVPHPIPEGYAWLNLMSIQVMPRTIRLALQELGVKEVAGPANSPIVMGYAHELGLEASYPADKIPWCGAFVGAIVKRAGKLPVHDPLWALNWKKFGVEADQPGLGDVLVFLRDGGGHVGFYVAEDRGTAANNHEDAAYHVLGGNQSDAVTITRVLKKRLQAARRPAYKVQPPAVKPYIVAANGALSRNEA